MVFIYSTFFSLLFLRTPRRAQYDIYHSVNQDEKTQRESLNKAPYDAEFAEYLLHAGGAKVCSSGS